jgi:aminoglycoside phosphotransferase (APT) family kinase protein
LSGVEILAEPVEPLVRRLIRSQFPDWSDLPLARLQTAGVDNVLFKLGDSLVVRLPREASSLEPLRKEQLWLPQLAPSLPLATPELMGIGEACDDYPWPWSINAWIEGVPATDGNVRDWCELASDLANFIIALWAVDSGGGPAPG